MFGTRPIDNKIYNVDWDEIDRRKDKRAVYKTYTGRLLGREVLKKTMQLFFKNGGLAPTEKEWFLFDGAIWTTREKLASYLYHVIAEEKEKRINTKYR